MYNERLFSAAKKLVYISRIEKARCVDTDHRHCRAEGGDQPSTACTPVLFQIGLSRDAGLKNCCALKTNEKPTFVRWTIDQGGDT